jgi:hypothetical protein
MPLAMTVRRTSKSTLRATAELRASRWKKSMLFAQSVLDEHPAGVARDERLEGRGRVVRDEDCRLVVPEILDE